MPLYMWTGVSVIAATTLLCLLVRPRVVSPWWASAVVRWLQRGMVLSLAASGLLLLIAWVTPVGVARVACPAAVAAAAAEACWMLLLWIGCPPPEDGDDDGPGPDEPGPSGPDGPLLPWEEFDRVRGEWQRPSRSRTLAR
ncbi:hypothetical protein NBH00_11010 [Paraconexibacter antarcticus]|uniref:Uncharacterized protein n=1 Tax=Paraconexibacter antarcticus TaxID=2949664 RepID=A0ABY5DYU4_9ACTN|nr:hypothetical protein [Paraconexibacter antarcticus]UTI66715.1 hypothetical protein NBH00_11010 [Paraconexibacter antarcticus]